MTVKRRNHYDVTNRVRISHPDDVCSAVVKILKNLYPGVDLRPTRKAFKTFTKLYAGTLPGYIGCDTLYHDTQHSLDCALAYARLLDGYERNQDSKSKLGPRRGILGIVVALFHDAGYIRHEDDDATNGAEYTFSHVRRSGEFLANLLPELGYSKEVNLTRQVVHFTGYEIALDQIKVANAKDRVLGFLLGTADILAQTSDRCYLEKCRDYLFREFEICGIAGKAEKGEKPRTYPTSKDLLLNTPEFNQSLWDDRLDGYFKSVHQHMKRHFDGADPYRDQIDEHLELIVKLGKKKDFSRLTRRPKAVDANVLRSLLGMRKKTESKSKSEGRQATSSNSLAAAA